MMINDLPVLVVTNPVWISMFRRGAEDPHWGRRPIDQHAIAMSIHELANSVVNEEERTALQDSALRLMHASLSDLGNEDSA